MSRVFSNTDGLDGLVQKYEEETGVDFGHVSDNTTRLKQFVSKTRSAWDMYLHLAIQSSGLWQFDDSGHSKYPVIYSTITSGQQDYPFTTDEQGNLILDIYKVAILPSATSTLYEEIQPIDAQGRLGGDLIADLTVGGVPTRYDKLANAIFLDPIPDYTIASGIKVYINRESSYFKTDDTTKKPGCPGIHHDYFYLRPAMEHARQNNLSIYPTLRDEVLKYEGLESRGIVGIIERYFSKRSKDEKYIMTPEKINYE